MGKSRSRKKRNFSHFQEKPSKSEASETVLPPLPSLPQLPKFNLNDSGPVTAAPGAEEEENEGWQQPKRPKKEKTRHGDRPAFQMSPMKIKHKLRVKELQELIIWLLAEGKAPQWLAVLNKPAINKVVVLLVPGLTMDMFNGSRIMTEIADTPMQVNDEDFGIPISRDGDELPPIEDPDDTEGSGALKKNTEREFSPLPPLDTYNDIMPRGLSGPELPSCLQPLSTIFKYVWPTTIGTLDDKNRLPNPVGSILARPYEKEEKRAAQTKYPKSVQGYGYYLLGIDELLEDGYPLHTNTLSEIRQMGGAIAQDVETHVPRFTGEGWKDTDIPGNATWKSSLGASKVARALAIDCEMVKTSEGFELARVSVVDDSKTVLYDKLVKPANPVVDYVTQYSGITEEKLKDVATTLDDVQADLVSLFKQTEATVLVGHSLESDLYALKLRHPYIIDTSVIFDHPRGKPYKPSLKWLANRYLKKEIQKGTKGHDSIEDAKTCIDLLRKKMDKGPSFGRFEEDSEPVFKLLARSGKVGCVVDWGNSTKFHGAAADRCVECNSDEDVVDGLIALLQGEQGINPDFLWGRLRELELARGFWTGSRNPAEMNTTNKSRIELATRKAGENIKRVFDALSPGTAFIVYSGTGDPRQFRKYQAMQNTFRDEYKVKKWDELSVKWTDAEDRQMKEGLNRAKEGVAFLTVKGQYTPEDLN